MYIMSLHYLQCVHISTLSRMAMVVPMPVIGQEKDLRPLERLRRLWIS